MILESFTIVLKNAASIPQNLVFKRKWRNLNKDHSSYVLANNLCYFKQKYGAVVLNCQVFSYSYQESIYHTAILRGCMLPKISA